jgi:heme-degrading monooxygenase HmoA
MIVRTWRGRAPADKPEDYAAHFNKTVLPELRALPGFVHAMLLRQARPEGFEFLVLTTWVSLDAVKAFAGERYERAVVEPGAVAALESFDATVEHFDLIMDAWRAMEQPAGEPGP